MKKLPPVRHPDPFPRSGEPAGLGREETDGLQDPNIDRAKEGIMFTDYYREQSCMAGRAFIRLHPLHVKNLTVFLGPAA